MILAVPTVFAGFFGLDGFYARQLAAQALRRPGGVLEQLFAPFDDAPLPALVGLGAIAFGFSLAHTLYRGASRDPLPAKLGALSRAMRDRFYFDELYQGLIGLTHEALARLADWFDRWIVAGLAVRGIHGTTEIFGRALRLVQTGNLQTYAFLFVAGVVVVLFYALK